MFKKSHYLITLLIVGFFLSSCFDQKASKVIEQLPDKIAPTSSYSIEASLRLSRQIQLLTNNSSIITISDTKSMVPTLDSNSLVLSEPIFIFNSLKVGDIIIYKNNNSNSIYFNKNIIHRIHSIDYKNQILTTKGDNCLEPDNQEIVKDQIIGRLFCIIYASEEIKVDN